MANMIPSPPAMSGTADNQLTQLKSYLYQAIEAINVAFSGTSTEKTVEKLAEVVNEGGTGDTATTYARLTSLLEKAGNVTSRQSSGGGASVLASLQAVYPVGAIYMSTVATNPATIFGFGSWEQIKDTFLLSAGDTYTAGSTGGEATHTLTVDEMPSHSHTTNIGATLGTSEGGYRTYTSGGVRITDNTSRASDSKGGGEAHNNMPPYLAVYVFKRVE